MANDREDITSVQAIDFLERTLGIVSWNNVEYFVSLDGQIPVEDVTYKEAIELLETGFVACPF